MEPTPMSDDYLDGKARKSMDRLKEIKVKIPVRQIVALHYLKISKGLEISNAVTSALGDFFEDLGIQAPNVPAQSASAPTDPLSEG